MLLDQRFELAFDVTWEKFDNEGLLINLKSESIFRLDANGVKVLELLTDGLSINRVVAVLQDIYAVDHHTLLRDVVDLIQTMLEQGLIKEVTKPST